MERLTITPKQKEILLYLYNFRFLNTHHFQKLFNHKDPHRIKVWLTDLINKGYISRNYSRKTITESTTPAVYYLAPKAIHILKENENCDSTILQKIYKEKTRTNKFITRCLTIADLYFFFLSQKSREQELHFFTASMLAKYKYFPDPLPAAFIAVKEKETTRRYFLDTFDEYIPSSVIRHRLRSYLQYASSMEWESNAHNEPLPVILFVCPSERVRKHISFYAKALFEKSYEEKLSLFLTTIETIQNNKKEIWEKVEL